MQICGASNCALNTHISRRILPWTAAKNALQHLARRPLLMQLRDRHGLFVLFTWSAKAYAKPPKSLKVKIMKKIDQVDLVFQKVATAALISTGTNG